LVSLLAVTWDAAWVAPLAEKSVVQRASSRTRARCAEWERTSADGLGYRLAAAMADEWAAETAGRLADGLVVPMAGWMAEQMACRTTAWMVVNSAELTEWMMVDYWDCMTEQRTVARLAVCWADPSVAMSVARSVEKMAGWLSAESEYLSAGSWVPPKVAYWAATTAGKWGSTNAGK
jgi:hypothetical protein